MNYIRHLNAFFSVVRGDSRLTSSHVSLYMALFQYWNFNRFQNPFPVYRDTMMQLSKIGSKNTYHKCIKELHLASYIVYHPAVSKYQPVKISMIRLDTKLIESKYQQLDMFSSNLSSPLPPSPAGECRGEVGVGSPNIAPLHVPNPTPASPDTCPNNGTVYVPNLTDTSTDNGTTQVPKMGHLIKQNILKKRETPTHKIFERNKKIQNAVNNLPHVPNMGHTEHKQESSKALFEACDHSSRSALIPTLSEVEEFFRANNYPKTEAKKFYNHYKAIGWKIQGVAPIEDWKALVEKWMINSKKWEPANGDKSRSSGEADRERSDIQGLYQQFLQAKKIFSLIHPEHFDEINLQLTEKIMEEAFKERINQVSGTNNHSLNQLWQAYLSNKPDNPLLQKDNPNLIAVAKRLAVLNHFKIQKQNGVTSLS